MKLAPKNWNDLWGNLIVEELRRLGVDLFCVSPGSRSTPLALSVAEICQDDTARAVVHFDERGAGYYAVGYAKATGRPAALICTSGTAAANYLPAIVEAAQSFTPLLVLTADRPPELLDTGANQAIDQAKLFGDYVRWQHTLPCPHGGAREAATAVLTAVDQAYYRATRPPAGPVHLNCQFREPLGPVPEEDVPQSILSSVAKWRERATPYTRYAAAPTSPSPDTVASLAEAMLGARRGLLVVGALQSSSAQAAVDAVARALGWPVFADITSGLRLGHGVRPYVPNYDALLRVPGFADHFRPDVVVHLGGPVVSKRLTEHLHRFPPSTYARVAEHPARHDPLHDVTFRIEANVGALCERLQTQLVSKAPSGNAWTDTLLELSKQVRADLHIAMNSRKGLHEPILADTLARLLPEASVLFLGNSMPIRAMDTYAAPECATTPVCANRGASGIDGVLATTVGFADGHARPATLLIGDVSLLHDLNSLALARRTSNPITIIVVNNNGGGIFDFLPLAGNTPHLERFFIAPHDIQFEQAARLFGLDYIEVRRLDSFVEGYRAAQHNARSTLLELFVARDENLSAYRELEKALAASAAMSVDILGTLKETNG